MRPWRRDDRAFALNPDMEVQGARLHAKQHLCDWTNLDEDTSRLLSAVRSGRLASVSFAMFSLSASAEDHFRCATRFAELQPAFPALWNGRAYGHDRIRVAYVSSDFNEHPVAALIVGLLRHHDRRHFEVVAISTSPGDDFGTARAGQKFVRPLHRCCREKRSGNCGVYPKRRDRCRHRLERTDHRQSAGMFARRPAPIQVNYLGYAGTIGAGYIDYILADPIVVPPEDFPFFSEKVVWLPDSFMISDNGREIGRTPSRGECGLPDTGFVFCCFNGRYKIAPDMFRIWMNLLRAVDNSVLWISEPNADCQGKPLARGRRSTGSRRSGWFSRRASPAKPIIWRATDKPTCFWIRLPYNAHSTANDALWAGLPVLTVLGSAFPGRVAASLLVR